MRTHTWHDHKKVCAKAHLKDVDLCDLLPALSHSEDSRLVHEVHELGACGAGCGPGYLVEVHISI